MFLPRSFWPLVFGPAGIFVFLTIISPLNAQLTINGANGVTASVSSNGTYLLSTPAVQLAGKLESPALNSRIASGTDNLGAYQELAFDYAVGASSRSASIR